MIKVESEVPFGRTLYTGLYLNNLDLNKVVHHNQVETRYLAWETVRKQINPFFLKGTGFEGYLIGRCPSSTAALEMIVSINQKILEAIARVYRFQFGFRSRLMKTLTKELSDPQAIHIWSSFFGAELGRLRAQILDDAQAQAFRNHTYNIVNSLPPIEYHEVKEDITQSYVIGSESQAKSGKLAVTLQTLPPSQQDAWLVAENIGEFGHPLVRQMLDHA